MPDYVIVGAGSAGCVLAARLTEDPDVSVTLIEAGPPDTAENIHVPVAFAKLYRTQFDWDYDTISEAACHRRRIYLPRGKMLGGSSSMNAMVYIRGNRADYDEWAALGCEGWSYDDLLPYFIRSERNERGADGFHGADGPLCVSEGRSRNAIAQAWLAAAIEAGHTRNDDFNGAEQDGVGEYQCNQVDGSRCSTSVSYLHPAMTRPNLVVETYMQVHKVLFEGTRAVGVVGERRGVPVEFRAEREVILCGGAYNSPQLLQLSGIGPAELLTAFEIPVVLDQPLVGQNLSDHANVGAIWTTSREESLLIGAAPEYLELFETQGQGPLTSNVAEVGGFMRSRDGLAAPDLQFHAAGVMFVEGGLGLPTAHGLSVGACVLHPAARGSVLIAGADPTTKPAIHHNYFGEHADLETAIAGVRAVLEIAEQPALAPYTEGRELYPDGDDDASLAEYCRAYVQTLYHPVGTCSMGMVVDNELRVNGVEGLRVVDASVLPTVPRGNTNAPVIAVAERASDLIRGKVPERAEAVAG